MTRLLHWMALDAVAVLLAYQWALARWVGVALPPEAWGFLAGGIWLAYMADRALDRVRHPEALRDTPKHAFLTRNRRWLVAVWGAVLLAMALAGPRLLGPSHLHMGLLLSGAAVLYVVVASRWIGEAAPALPRHLKRLAAVLLLAAAGAWWVAASDAWHGGWPVVAIFCVAAWLNLALLAVRREWPGSTALPLRPSRDHRALVLDGALAGGMVLLGLAAP